MKKFLIVTICLIPIILILALNGASSIVAINTPDNPTKIEIRDQNNKLISDSDVLEIELTNQDSFIIINIYPEITKNKNINPPELTHNSTGEVTLEKIEDTNRYRVLPQKPGYVELVISAETNISLKHKLSFIVKTNTIIEANILDANRRQIGVSNSKSDAVYEFGETYYLDYYAKPFDALDFVSPKWSFSPFGAAEVYNGHVVINDELEREITTVTFSAYGKDGVPISAKTKIDFTKTIVSRTLVHTKDVVDEDWIRENIVFNEYKESAVINKLEGNKYEVLANDRRVVITVFDGIEGDVYFSDGIETVYTNTSTPQLILSDANSGEVVDLDDVYSPYHNNVRFESSDSSMLEVDWQKGFIKPLKHGTCEVSAFIFDKEYKKTITIRDAKEVFSLKHNYIDEKRGIRQDRIWGTKFIEGGEDLTLTWQERLSQMKIIDTYDFFVEDDDATFDIIWETDKDDVIEIQRLNPIGEKNDIRIKFLETGLGQSVKLTAYMSDGKNKIEHFKRSFTFKILDRPNAINIFDDLQGYKVYQLRALDMVLQSDIEHDATSYNRAFMVYANIWGNGFAFTMDLSKGGPFDQSDNLIFFDRERGKLINTKEDDKIIYDDFILSFVPTLLDKNLEKMAGTGMYVQNCEKTPVTFRYLQVKNCYIGLQLRVIYNLTIEGCVLGDNRLFGSSMATDWHEDIDNSKFIVKNSIFTNSSGPSISFFFDDLPTSVANSDKNMLPNIIFEGNVRFYNWKTKEHMDSIADIMLNSFFPDYENIDAFRNLIGPFWASVMKDQRMGNMFMRYQGKEYASIGMFIYGLTANNDLNKLQLGDKYVAKELPIYNEGTAGILDAITLIGSMALNMEIGKLQASHIVGYDFSKGKPDVLPLEPVPATYEMYKSLTGGVAAPYK
ncbi:MAG TPA: hypothetical protein GX709_01670 [Clostridiales bacterium]|nr:hypothetical protein [Clostridiales bacterium]